MADAWRVWNGAVYKLRCSDDASFTEALMSIRTNVIMAILKLTTMAIQRQLLATIMK